MQCTHTVAAMAASVSLTVCLPHPHSSLDISGNKVSALPAGVFSGLSALRFAYIVHNSTMCVACVVACVSVHKFSHLLQGSPRMCVYLSSYACPVFTKQSIYRGGVCLCACTRVRLSGVASGTVSTVSMHTITTYMTD